MAMWSGPDRTHTDEFWECYDGDLDLPAAQAALRAWEDVYNTVRPHQALKYLTPAQVLARASPAFSPSSTAAVTPPTLPTKGATCAG